MTRSCQQAQKEVLAFMYSLKGSRSLDLVKIPPSIICIKNTIFSIGLGSCVINQGHTMLSDRQLHIEVTMVLLLRTDGHCYFCDQLLIGAKESNHL